MLREDQMAKWFFLPEISLRFLRSVTQKAPGPEMKGTVILLMSIIPSFHHLHHRLNNPSHSLYRDDTPINKMWNSYMYILTCDDCFILLCICCSAFKSLIKISLFIIQVLFECRETHKIWFWLHAKKNFQTMIFSSMYQVSSYSCLF